MTDSRYTPEGLPIVTLDSTRAYDEEIKRTTPPSFDENSLDSLRTENPHIFNYLEQKLVPHMSTEAGKLGITIGMSITYDLLRRQAIANKLEEGLK